MDKNVGINVFQIILKNNDEEDLSSYWQDQCQYLYHEIYMALPEGSIKPLILEKSIDEKVETITIFNVLNILFIDVTAKIFVDLILEKIKNWCSDRHNVDIEIKCPDGSMAKIPKDCIPNFKNFIEENSNLLLCEAIIRFINSTK